MSVSVNAQPPPPRERQRGDPPEQRRPEDEEGGGGGDPAVLAMGPARRPLRYSRDDLLALRDTRLSRAHPDIKHDAFNNIRKRTESPTEEDRGARGDAPGDNHKGYQRERRSADPRERVRKESESGGIVLSPQRRSFTSGCQAPGVPAAAPPHLARVRPESPLSTAGKPEPVRRIGSGRILRAVCDVTQPPWEREEPEPEPRGFQQPYRPPPAVARDRERTDRTDERSERRSFSRDNFSTDVKRDRERDERFIDKGDNYRREDSRRMNNNRYGNQRRYEKDQWAEPEWYSGGPTSQLETIELRGFDEPVREKKTNGSTKDSEKGSSGGRSPPPTNERWRSASAAPPSPPSARSTPTLHPDQSASEKESSQAGETRAEERGGAGPGRAADDFNLDDFLKFDSIPDLLTNGTSESEAGGSRFSRWFQRGTDSPSQHHEQLLNNMMDELDSQPAEPHVFAPIAPAAAPPPSLLELLQRANAASGPHPPPHEVTSGPTKIHSLEELEARMLGARPAPPPRAPPPPRDLHGPDLVAFKRLLAQVSGGHAVPANEPPPQHKPPPMSLLQMLNKSLNAEQQQKQQQQQQQQQQPPHIPQEVLYKLLQVQQRQQQQEMASGAADRELLQRTEAQAIIHGLRHGDLTPQHLVEQLSNPGLQIRHREMLHTILRHTRQRQMGGSPLPGAGGPHLVVPPHHQPLRLSPLPHTGVPQPMLSPRELAARTQSIMQQALIKKKLEESRENFRRRQEQPKPTPIALTPTSVLRKMTADKYELPNGAKPATQPWAQMPQKMPQGRPIVKGNHGGMSGVHGMFPPGQPEFSQQHYLNHAQMSSSRQYPHQHRQTPSQLDNLYMNSRGGSANTLQQLFAQSHHRDMNDMASGMGMLGGDPTNQLERWFSPELLAQAQAGKLPSVHVPNALCLEDLERTHHSTTVRN